jgi:Sec-independent protein translocase protein TatA
MRRTIFAAVGILELLAAIALIWFGWSLPKPRPVGQGFDRVENATRSASRQVGAVRRQVHDVRQPELRQLARKLEIQTQTVTRTLKSQQVDFDTVASLRTSLNDAAAGLDGLTRVVDPEQIGKLGTGFGETARFIDDSLVPSTTKIADQFDQMAAGLADDSKALSRLLRESTPDLKAARNIHDSLGKFDEGLEKMLKLIELKRLDAIKEGFAGLESSLDTTAGQVEKLAGYSYPSIKVRGLKIEVEERPFWPNGEKIADGLRKATEGVRAAQKEVDDIAKELPAVRKSLEESRKVVSQTRSVLGQTLKQQDKLERLLRDIPDRTAKLADDLPRLARELAKLLRETKHLHAVADTLRLAQKSIDATVTQWPEWRKGMKQTSALLRTSAKKLDSVIRNRAEYETSLNQSTELAETFSQMVPLMAEQVSSQLDEQESSLGDLEKNLDEVGDSFPEMKRTAIDLVSTGRILAWLFAGIVGLHGAFLVAENRKGKPLAA